MLKHVILFLVLSICQILPAQNLNPVTWETSIEKTDSISYVRFHASIEPGWYLYATELPEDGPIPTQFVVNDSLITANINAISAHEINVYDEMFMMELKKYKEAVDFYIPLTAFNKHETIEGYIEFMCCNDMQCLAPKQINFTLNLN